MTLLLNLKTDGIKALTGDKSLSELINSNISMLNDFSMNE